MLNSDAVRSQIFDGPWPLLTDERVEADVNATLSRGITRRLAQIRENIRRRLLYLQNKKLDEVIHTLSRVFNVSRGAISQATVETYLTKNDSSAEKQLIDEIAEGFTPSSHDDVHVRVFLF